MSCQRKRRITTFLFLLATLSVSFRNTGSATDGNWSIHEKLNLENQTKSKDIVYHQMNSLEEANWPSRLLFRHPMQSNAANNVSAKTEEWSSEVQHSRLELETDDLSQRSLPRTNVFSSFRHSAFHKHNDTPNDRLEKLSPQKWPSDVKDGVQPDYAEYWLEMRLSVYCSGAAMTIAAKGRGCTSLLVERVDTSPVSVLHLPSRCGFFVRVTWKDLVLTVPYNGCYILHKNGSYVLPLLWWGRPVKVSCPMTPASSPAPLSGFCSHFGMIIEMKGVQGAMKKAVVEVNGEWLPLVSDMCAYCMGFPSEDLLIIPFTALCAMAGSSLAVLLNGRVFTLACQPTLHPSSLHLHLPSSQLSPPLGPGHTSRVPLHTHTQSAPPQSSTASEAIKTRMVSFRPRFPPGFDPVEYLTYLIDPHIYIVPHAYIDPMWSLVPPVSFGGVQKGSIQYPHPSKPFHYMPQVPDTQASVPASATTIGATTIGATTIPIVTKATIASATTSKVDETIETTIPSTVMPMRCPPHRHTPYLYPYYYSLFHQAPLPSVQQTPKCTTWRISLPKQTPKPQTTSPSSRPPRFRQVPGFPEPPAATTSSPSLTCTRDTFIVLLPSAKMESIKVKDVKRNEWVPVISAPEGCGYSLQCVEKGVVLLSPLPACHMCTLVRNSTVLGLLHVLKQCFTTQSPFLLTLSVKFWDPTLSQHRTLQLQCPYTSPLPAATTVPPALWTWPASSPTPTPIPTTSQPLKPITPPAMRVEPTAPSAHASKPITLSFQPPKHALPTSWPSEHSWPSEITPLPSQTDAPQIRCYSQNMSVTLPPGPITDLTVHTPPSSIKAHIKPVALDKNTSHCGYVVKEDHHGHINIFLPYTSCHMALQDGKYKVVLKYQSADGHTFEAWLSCQVPVSKECSLPIEQQLPCGFNSISSVECHKVDCCYSSNTATCYYPMDECTADRHFVFSIPASFTDPPLSPAFLVAAGNTSCAPQRVAGDSALFKIPLDGCGVHRYEVGNGVIYMMEILNTLTYGTIPGDSPFRLLVTCQYLPGAVASVGYLVKSPSLGSSIRAHGTFGVQLRIAEDQKYSSYYPQYHRPLRKLLGKPLYLEVRLLNPPDSSAVLLVHYCVAYPRSAHSAWILIHDGCPNPLDITATHMSPLPPEKEIANHVKRFTVSTFQFLKSSHGQSEPGGLGAEEEEEEEEIYFMCATEVCLPSEGPCVEGCFSQSVQSTVDS